MKRLFCILLALNPPLVFAGGEKLEKRIKLSNQYVASGSIPASGGSGFIHGVHDHVTYNANGTYYIPPAGYNVSNATEGPAQIPYRTDGTASQLAVYLISNSIGASSYLRLRVNGANSVLIATLTANTAGWFTSEAGKSVAIAAGDKLSFQLSVPNSGTNLNLNAAYFLFAPTTGGMIKYGSTGYTAVTNWWPTWYQLAVGGMQNLTSQTVDTRRFWVKQAGTFKNMAVYASANTSTGNTNWIFVKNGVEQNLKCVFSQGTTGLVEDYTNTVSVVEGDTVTVHAKTTTAQDGGFTPNFMAVEFVPASTTAEYVVPHEGKTFSAGDGTVYTTFQGPLGVDSGYATYETPSYINATIGNLRVYVSANTLSAPLPITLLLNGGATSVTTSIPAGATGTFYDLAHTTGAITTDKLSYKIAVPAGTGQATVQYIAATVQNTN